MDNLKTVNSIIDLAVNVVVWLLALRFFLKLFGANPDAFFVSWIYAISMPLLIPFRGIFNTPQVSEESVLELGTLFAIVIYVIIGYFIKWLVTIIRDNISHEKMKE